MEISTHTVHIYCNYVHRAAVWSGAGLTTQHTSNGVVNCSVEHLTGFAVLVSPAQVSAETVQIIRAWQICICIVTFQPHGIVMLYPYLFDPTDPTHPSFPSDILHWMCHFPSLPHCYYHLPTHPEVSAVGPLCMIMSKAVHCSAGNSFSILL